jgi:hypothetical protein
MELGFGPTSIQKNFRAFPLAPPMPPDNNDVVSMGEGERWHYLPHMGDRGVAPYVP